jgi:hypothetical protein
VLLETSVGHIGVQEGSAGEDDIVSVILALVRGERRVAVPENCRRLHLLDISCVIRGVHVIRPGELGRAKVGADESTKLGGSIVQGVMELVMVGDGAQVYRVKLRTDVVGHRESNKCSGVASHARCAGAKPQCPC